MGERGPPTPIVTLVDKSVNALYWSPRGDHVVLAGMQVRCSAAPRPVPSPPLRPLPPQNLSGTLEFYDIEQRKTYATAEHERCSEVLWDPSGRMVATTKVQPLRGDVTTRDTVENGFVLWTFQGARLSETLKSRVYSFAWRPRPEGCVGGGRAGLHGGGRGGAPDSVPSSCAASSQTMRRATSPRTSRSTLRACRTRTARCGRRGVLLCGRGPQDEAVAPASSLGD